jgi:hypothetical protein
LAPQAHPWDGGVKSDRWGYASMDADATPTPIAIPSGDLPSAREPTDIPSVPSGSPESSLLVRLDEDVSALRMEIGVSRAREENLFERVKTLEALVATLRRSVLKSSAVAAHRHDVDDDVMRGDEEDEEDEEDEFIDVKPSGMRRKTARGRVPNRQNVRLARDAGSESESSTSEAESVAILSPHGGARERKGPRVAGLVELTTRRPEFRPLVSYRSYRLAIRDQTVDDRITSKVNAYLKMMKHHVSEPFTGEHAIRIFDFLSGMRDALNVNRISEGAVYLLLPHFLGGKAKHGVLSRWKQAF